MHCDRCKSETCPATECVWLQGRFDPEVSQHWHLCKQCHEGWVAGKIILRPNPLEVDSEMAKIIRREREERDERDFVAMLSRMR